MKFRNFCWLMGIICAMFFQMFSAPVLAATFEYKNITLNWQERTIVVTGKLKGYSPDQRVTLQISPIDNNPSIPIIDVDEDLVGLDGSYVGHLSMGMASSGYYMLSVNLGDSTYYTQKLLYNTQGDITQGINAIKDAALDANSFPDVFKLQKMKLGLQYDLFDSLGINSIYQTNIYNKMFEITRNADKCNWVDINLEFEKACTLQAVNKATTALEIKYLVETFNSILMLNVEEERYSNTFTDADRNAVMENLATKDYADFDGVRLSFDKFVLLQRLKSAINYTEVSSILTDSNNSRLLGDINLEDYNCVKDKKLVAEKILNEIDLYNTLDKVVEKFEEFSKKQYESEQMQSSKPQNVGSSGGGGNSIIYKPPAVEDTQIVEPNKEDTDKEYQVYSDMVDVGWAQEAVRILSGLKIVNGRDAKTFAPNENVTREEFVKMLYLSAGQQIAEDVECSFEDVLKETWYYSFIANAYEKGLVNGTANGNFGIGEKITRQDMAVMVVRMMSYLEMMLPESKNSSFEDASEIDEYARLSVDIMVQLEIINGYGTNHYLPKQYSTRAEAAKVIYGFYKYLNASCKEDI